MTPEQLKEWRAFCGWLNEQKYKCAYSSAVPAEWSHLVYRGGNRKGQQARDARRNAKLIFYWEGWGWRLKKNWRERISELERFVNDTKRQSA